MGIAEQIRQRVQALSEGQLVTTAQLLGLGTRAAIDQPLARLACQSLFGTYPRQSGSKSF